jgi:2-hydroxychromene-2-carboxylate isomerase
MVLAVTLQFWFEFASTYTYPAAMRVEKAAQNAGVDLEYCPFLLGPIFAKQGWNDSPFNIYPAKGRYMWRDLERLCASLSLPFRKPTVFPRNGLLAARVATVGRDEPWGPAFVRGVFHANFAEDRDIASPEVVSAVLESAGQDPAAVLSRAASQEIKQELRERTDAAQTLGIFGAPSFVVDGEIFWGNDRLEMALEFARKRGR